MYGSASEETYKTHNVKRDASEEWDYAINSLKIDLREFIEEELPENEEDKSIYLVFSVDETKVYSNDYDDVVKVLTDYETKYEGKIRYKINTLEGG